MRRVLEDATFPNLRGPAPIALRYNLYIGEVFQAPLDDRVTVFSLHPEASKRHLDLIPSPAKTTLVQNRTLVESIMAPKVSLLGYKLKIIYVVAAAVVAILIVEYIRSRFRAEREASRRIMEEMAHMTPGGIDGGDSASLDCNIFIAPGKVPLGSPPGAYASPSSSSSSHVDDNQPQISKWMTWNSCWWRRELLPASQMQSRPKTPAMQYAAWCSLVLPIHVNRSGGSYSAVYEHVAPAHVLDTCPEIAAMLTMCMPGYIVTRGTSASGGASMIQSFRGTKRTTVESGVGAVVKSIKGIFRRSVRTQDPEDVGAAGNVDCPLHCDVPKIHQVYEWEDRFSLQSTKSSRQQMSTMLAMAKHSPADLRRMLKSWNVAVGGVGGGRPSAKAWLSQVSEHAGAIAMSCTKDVVMQDWSNEMGTGVDLGRRHVNVYRALKSQGVCITRMTNDFSALLRQNKSEVGDVEGSDINATVDATKGNGDARKIRRLKQSQQIYEMSDVGYEALIGGVKKFGHRGHSLATGGRYSPGSISNSNTKHHSRLTIFPDVAAILTTDLLLVNELQQSVRLLMVDSSRRPYDPRTWWC